MAKLGFRNCHTPLPSRSVEAILKSGTADIVSKYRSNKIPLKAQAFDIMPNGNIVFYKQGKLGIWSLLEDKEFLLIDSKPVSAIRCFGDSKFIVALQDGTVQFRSPMLDLLTEIAAGNEVADLAFF
mmetsp:Transcript_38533/g.28383  ORF Transcript_38533/g.28383 Transcript_38533/m.28383 type:complete len:126 (-) Transcript_38533:1686-2063(-)